MASTSNDPRFPAMPMPVDDMGMMPQQDDGNMMPLPVDRGFSRRANAHHRVGATTSTRGGGGGSFASRGGGRSGRPAPIYSGSRRGSRSTNDGNDATDLSAVDVEVDAFETGSQKSSYSRTSSKGAGTSRKRRKSPRRAPGSQGSKAPPSDKSTRIYQLFPVETKESEAESLQKAQENAIAWNEPENMTKLRVLEGIFDEYMEQMKALRRAKYERLNQSPERNVSAEESAGQEAPAMVAQEQA
ncbi:hypothetical protein QFC22_004871 [Naganishia vaughanmartiniae]|uniref:Uncharacterized protein n=1 Tax=Naganishia vaughanmartiniae TaxID=1424756 RepID=A0ACC2WZ84_9TREE|nr:hypothetical protein QFC22_004871 [Naganishia vaughanmartiniae]